MRKLAQGLAVASVLMGLSGSVWAMDSRGGSPADTGQPAIDRNLSRRTGMGSSLDADLPPSRLVNDDAKYQSQLQPGDVWDGTQKGTKVVPRQPPRSDTVTTVNGNQMGAQEPQER